MKSKLRKRSEAVNGKSYTTEDTDICGGNGEAGAGAAGGNGKAAHAPKDSRAKSLQERLRDSKRLGPQVEEPAQREHLETATTRRSSGNNGRSKVQKITAGLGRPQAYKKPRKTSSPQGRDDPDHDPQLSVLVYAVKKTGGGVAAFLLSQLVYWRSEGRNGQPRMKAQPLGEQYELPDEEEWAWGEGYSEMGRQIAASRHQVGRAVKACFKAGLLAELEGEDYFVRVEDGRHLRRSFLRLHPRVLHRLKKRGELDGTNKSNRVLVPRSFITITGNHNQALVLAAIYRWFVPNKRGKLKLCVFRAGHWWRSNSYGLLAEETGLSVDQVKHAIQGLRKRRFIDTRQWQSGFERGRLFKTLHVRPLKKAIKEAQRKARE